MSRIAAPMVGGMITAPLLSLFVLPAAYLLVRRRGIDKQCLLDDSVAGLAFMNQGILSMTSAFWFPIAAILEIAGCFSFWAWLRLEKSAIWLIPGMVALAGFAWVLTQVEASFAGRAYAAYGGVYIAASLIWGALVEKQAPSILDLLGAFICLIGASIIFLGPSLMRQ